MGRAAMRNNLTESGLATGRPVVFSHGFGCDQSMWRFVAPRFAAEYRVVLFDHTGFGGSDAAQWDPQRHDDLAGYAADLLELLGELGLDDVVFVGHSVAAMIGLLASIAQPERFGELVMVGPSPRYLDDPASGYVGGFTPSDIEDLLDALDSNYLGWSHAMAPVIMGHDDRPELGRELTNSFCRTDPRVARSFARATFLADNRLDLPRVTTPTLVLQCADDPIAPAVVGEYVHQAIAGCTLVRLQATGHCPNLSAPDETSSTILRYLANCDR